MNEIEKHEPSDIEIQKQEEFFSKPDSEQARIRERDLGIALEDKRIEDFRTQFESEKALMEKRDGLEFDELKKGDVFLFETMKDVKFEADEFFDKIEKNIKGLPEDDPLAQKGAELLKVGRRLLEMADRRPFGDGERQLLFDQIRDVVNMYPDLFEDEDVRGRYRVEVTGTKRIQSESGETEDRLLVRVDSDSHGESNLKTSIVKSDFRVGNTAGILGRIIFGRVRKDGEHFSGGMGIPRVGRVYK